MGRRREILSRKVEGHVRKPLAKSPLSRRGLLQGIRIFLFSWEMLYLADKIPIRKYGKHEQLCVLPSLFGNQVVLPPSLVQFIVDQPNTVLSPKDAQIDFIEGTHTMLDPRIVLNPIHEHVIRRELKLHLNDLIPELQDEVSKSLDDILPIEASDFSSVNLDGVIRQVVARASNRIFLGDPLCKFKNPCLISQNFELT